MNTQSFYNYQIDELSSFLSSKNYKEVHAKSIFQSIYKFDQSSFNSLETLPQSLARELEKKYHLNLPKLVKTQISSDKETVKFLVQLDDSNKVETVLVPFNKKYTICISSQVGCAMKCSFCYTGTQGLTRNLEPYEIIGQYLLAYRWLKINRPEKSSPPNIVFMGQGEPLHNYENVKKAINILLTTEGLYLGPRQITLSTAGYLPGIKVFKDLGAINFALSFHSPFNEERSELIPLNKAYPIEEIIEELRTLPRLKRQYLTFEYLLIKDLNHSNEHIKKIYELLKDMPVIFNIIPFNPFPGSKFQRPQKEDVDAFARKLEEKGFHVMVRTTKGDDILAACGQLNT